MDFEGAKTFATTYFQGKDTTSFYYHNLSHTLDVYQIISILARAENILEDEIILLQTAALFHDLGIMIKYFNHEKESVKIIRSVLPGFGYTKPQIDIISKFILDTEISKRPRSKLSRLLRDADVDYLGRPDYPEISLMLRKELAAFKIKKYTDKEWYQFQYTFLTNHRFNSSTACLSRNEGKLININKISEILKFL